MERGVAILDLVIEITPVDGEAIRLLTHSSRPLQAAIDGFAGEALSPG